MKEKDVIQELVDGFFSISPKYRTKKKLYELMEESYEQGHATGVIIGERIDKAVRKKPLQAKGEQGK
jgi:hypothetical protein